MSKRNAGVFPLNRVHEVIDGAGVGHGSRDMPVWGRDYRVPAAGHCMEVPHKPEAYVRARILALAEHLGRLQAP